MTERPLVFDAPAADEPLPVELPEGPSFEYQGERFRVSEAVGLAPLMDFAELADQGVDTNAMAGLVAMKDMLREVIHEEDWDRFWRWTKRQRVTAEGFAEILAQAMAVVDLQARPTESPSGSPGGQGSTGPSSNGTYGSPASRDAAWTERKRALDIVPIRDDAGL